MKLCSECGEKLIRTSIEGNHNWKIRKTCGGQCRVDRQRRLARLKANKQKSGAFEVEVRFKL